MSAATSSPAQGAGEDLVSVIRADHQEIRSLFAAVESATEEQARRDAFEGLVRKLAVHETAEEEVVRPAVRAAGGDDVADQRNQEEDGAKKALSELERLGPGSPEFPTALEALKAEVLVHAEREEQEEHPLLLSETEERRRALADVFRAAEATAPTHPHPHGPESATGNVVVGPAVALADRARDAVRAALRKIGG
jgi:hypothetical protein